MKEEETKKIASSLEKHIIFLKYIYIYDINTYLTDQFKLKIDLKARKNKLTNKERTIIIIKFQYLFNFC